MFSKDQQNFLYPLSLLQVSIKKIYFTILLISFTTATQAQFVAQNVPSNLNTFTNGFELYTTNTLNTPTNYGTILALGYLPHPSDELGWRTQLAFGTENDFYYRQSTNNGGTVWSGWNKIFHSGNLNSSNIDFNANRLTTKELSIYSGEYDSNGWGTSHIYWQGHSMYMGSPKGPYAHNSLVLRPGGSPQGFIDNSLSIDVAHGIDNYETRILLSGSTNSYINSGNFGIGTTNPKNKLDVKGTIHSQEVKVDMLNWSDHVFKNEYNLPTLIEVEKHINENGHLKDIPSEKEVLKNGINLGEMDAKLLQKIEELTLYIIDLNKKIEQQNQELNLMKEKLNTK